MPASPMPASPTDPSQPRDGAPPTRPTPAGLQAERAQHAAVRLVQEPVVVQPVSVAVAVVLAGLVVLGGYAGVPLIGALAMACVVLAQGWAPALGLPSPRGSMAVLLVTAAACLASVAATLDEPFLRYLPAGLALGVIAAFLHQLLRRDGRPRLVESVAGTVLGVGLVASGAGLYPMSHLDGGPDALAVAMAALAAGALTDLLGLWRPLRPWLLLLSVLAGIAAGSALADALSVATWGQGALLGGLTAGIPHLLRRASSTLPSVTRASTQLTGAAAGLLATGLVCYVVGRTVLG